MAIVPGEPFSSFLSCQTRASAIVVVCLGVKVVLVVPRQKFQVDCVYPRPRPRSRPGRAVFVDGSLGLLMAIVELRPCCGRPAAEEAKEGEGGRAILNI